MSFLFAGNILAGILTILVIILTVLIAIMVIGAFCKLMVWIMNKGK